MIRYWYFPSGRKLECNDSDQEHIVIFRNYTRSISIVRSSGLNEAKPLMTSEHVIQHPTCTLTTPFLQGLNVIINPSTLSARAQVE